MSGNDADATSVAGSAGLETFAAFTPTHAIVVVVAALLVVPVIALGRRWHASAPRRERRLRRAIAGGIVLVQAWSLWFWLHPERLDATISLPLHVCDLVPWIAAAVLAVGPARWPAAAGLVYFWGIGLSGWGFVWPVLEKGPSTMHFWLFWAVHAQIVGTAGYVALASSWRPSRRELRIAAACTILYAIAITPVNLGLEADYGYVGPGDGPAALLGPWPWRLPLVVAGQIAIFALLWLPWRRNDAEGASPSA